MSTNEARPSPFSIRDLAPEQQRVVDALRKNVKRIYKGKSVGRLASFDLAEGHRVVAWSEGSMLVQVRVPRDPSSGGSWQVGDYDFTRNRWEADTPFMAERIQAVLNEKGKGGTSDATINCDLLLNAFKIRGAILRGLGVTPLGLNREAITDAADFTLGKCSPLRIVSDWQYNPVKWAILIMPMTRGC